MKPLEFDWRYGELDQVISAYLGMPAAEEPGKPSEALHAYLRHTWHTRPWALATAERHLRDYARNPRACGPGGCPYVVRQGGGLAC